MEILSYLTELVKTRKEVGVAGLGTFYKKKSPGRYDAGTHSFLPPSFTLDFTEEVREQTALATFVSRRRNISYDSAAYYIEQFAADMQKQLTDAQQAELGELGQLSSTSGELRFTPKSESNFGFDFYGLPSLKDSDPIAEKPVNENTEETIHQEVTEEQLILEENNADLSDGSGEFEELHHEEKDIEEEPIVYQETDAVTNTPEIDETTVTESVTTDTVTAPYIETVTQPDSIVNYSHTPAPLNNYTQAEEEQLITENQSQGMPLYLKVITVLVVLSLVLAALYYVKPELFRGIINKGVEQVPLTTQTQADIDKLKTDSAAFADSVKKGQENVTTPIDTLKDSAAVNVSKITESIETAVKYEIIAASLANKREAEDFLAQMKRNGIPAKVADMPGRRIKISIGTFNDEASAKKELELLKKSTRIPGIYIYPIRHTKKSQ